MSENRISIRTPIGRLVQGSLYDGSDTDLENRPRVYKTGANAGQPRLEFFLAMAVPKGTEQHWNQTEWGRKIWEVGVKAFPTQHQYPTFAWKVKDGDSDMPNKKGRIPRDIEGYAGNWILYFTSSFAPQVVNHNGTEPILQKDFVNPGDFIQVFAYINDNGSQQQPGLFLNPSIVAFSGYGKRIILGIDPKSVGFGQEPLPAGLSQTPLDGFTPPSQPATTMPPASTPPAYVPPAQPVTMPPVAAPVQPMPPVAAPVQPMPPVQAVPPAQPAQPMPPVQAAAPAPSLPPPHPGILEVPVAKTMTAKANGVPYEQFIASGWNDAQLIQHGYMTA